MARLPARHAGVVQAFFTSLFMSLLMSAAITRFNVGDDPAYLSLWMRAFAIAFCIAFPAILLVLPLARRLTAMVTVSD